MGKKKSNMPLIIGVAVIFAIMGAAGAYMYTSGEYNTGYAAGMAYQQTQDRTNVPASLTCSLASATFADFSAAVAADGSVATETPLYTNLTISNDDEDRIADDVRVELYNQVTDKEGLDDDLEQDSTEYSVTSGGGTYKLVNDGEYVSGGFLIGDIPPGGEWILMQTMTLEVASAGTYENGQSYSCHLYVYQETADYCDVVDFTVAT